MGITISHALSQRKVSVKSTLDRAEKLARIYKEKAKIINLDIEIRRKDDMTLRIDISGCETLMFSFKTVKEIMDQKINGYSYEYNVLTDSGKTKLDEGYAIEKYPQNEIVYSADFCKTQFAKTIVAHRFVAELIRIVASYCLTADVYDEGDYYNSGDITDAIDAKKENGELINKLKDMFK